MRRSAAMSPLSLDDQRRLLDACAELVVERARITAVLADLPSSWSSVRAALNELQRIVGAPAPPPAGHASAGASSR